MTTKKILEVWVQSSGIEIWEIEHDNDTCAYGIAYDGKHVVTIYPDSPEQAEEMRASLDAGEDVRDWEDDLGNSVGTLISQRTTGLRDTLKRIENAGTCYNDRLDNGKDGTIWVDEAHRVNYKFWADKVIGAYYEYETDNLDLSVYDLTDEDLKDIRIGGL